MTFDKFIAKYNGKATDYDGACGVQCVDLAKAYLTEVFGIKVGSWGDAKYYWLDFEKHPDLVKAFDKIKNTPDFIPQKGDIAVWNGDISSSNNCGHVAVCDGNGDLKSFYSYDQNYNGKACKRVKHDYRSFYGVLRPKNQNVLYEGSEVSNKPTAGEYITTANVNVRKGPGTNYLIVYFSQFTANAKKQVKSIDKSCPHHFPKGIKVTLSEFKQAANGKWWGKCPSGWISMTYCKKS